MADFKLKGHDYVGRFSINKRSHSYTTRVDCEFAYHDQEVTNSWFEGEGSIIKRGVNIPQRFGFGPKGDLEKDVVLLGDLDGKRIIDYKGIIDVVMEDLYCQAERSQEIIPVVKIPVLSLEYLAKKGFITEPSGQINVPLLVG